MSNRGYAFESEIEDYFLTLEGKTKQDPILDHTGKVMRTFRVPTSGAMASFPGDVITGNQNFPQQLMIECKARFETTKKKGQVFRLDTSWVDKNEEESRKMGIVPIFVLSFKKTKKNRIWAVLDPKVYLTFFSTLPTTPCPFTRKKRTITLVKADLDKNPISYLLEQRCLVPWEHVYEEIKKWKKL